MFFSEDVKFVWPLAGRSEIDTLSAVKMVTIPTYAGPAN